MSYKLKGWIDVKPCPKCKSNNIYTNFNFEHLNCVWCYDCEYLIKRRAFEKAIEFWNSLKREKSNKAMQPTQKARG